jgi:hypothetical protein
MTLYNEAKHGLMAEAERMSRQVGQDFQPSAIRLVRATKGEPLPRGVVYIGREFGGHRASPLANDFKITDIGTREKAMGAFMRQLAERVASGHQVVEQLRKLEAGSRLGCWCAERQAVLLWTGRGLPADACHGDAIASMHEALTTEGYWTGGRGRGFLASAALIFARAFGTWRLVRSRLRRETDAWLREQGREGLPELDVDGTRARACDECNGRGYGCGACCSSGFWGVLPPHSADAAAVFNKGDKR